MELIGSPIGNGSCASVFAHKRDSSAVVKVADEMFERSLKNEICFYESVQHELLPKFLGSGTTEEGLPYLIIERFVDSLENTHFETCEEKIAALTAVAEAIKFIHSKNFVHRDISAANVLVSGSRVVLSDFGHCLNISARSEIDKLAAKMEDFRQFAKLMMFEAVNLKFIPLTGKDSLRDDLEKKITLVISRFDRNCSIEIQQLITDPRMIEYAKTVFETLKEIRDELETKLLAVN